MDQHYHDKVEQLRKKHPSSITEHDRAEIRALRAYFHPHELASFGIKEEAAPEASDEAPVSTPEVPKPANRSKAKAKAADEAPELEPDV